MHKESVSVRIFSLLFLVAWPFELPVADEAAPGKAANDPGQCLRMAESSPSANSFIGRLKVRFWPKVDVLSAVALA